jgi:hypothetical protein
MLICSAREMPPVRARVSAVTLWTFAGILARRLL